MYTIKRWFRIITVATLVSSIFVPAAQSQNSREIAVDIIEFSLTEIRKGGEYAERYVRDIYSRLFTRRIGGISFVNTKVRGRWGEMVTHDILIGKGYEKVGGFKDHGIDGVYIKTDANGSIVEALIVETKVKDSYSKAKVFPPADNKLQMSDAWVKKSLYKEIGGTPADRKSRYLLRAVAEDGLENGAFPVRKEYWAHALKEEKTFRFPIKDTGSTIGSPTELESKSTMIRILNDKCGGEPVVC
mgnify:CR=1 FL=1